MTKIYTLPNKEGMEIIKKVFPDDTPKHSLLNPLVIEGEEYVSKEVAEKLFSVLMKIKKSGYTSTVHGIEITAALNYAKKV